MKKIVSLFVAIVVAISLVAIPVKAEGGVTIYLESSLNAAKAGEQIAVTLNSSEGSNLAGLSNCIVTYDKSRLEYISTVFAQSVGGYGFTNDDEDGIHIHLPSTGVLPNSVATITFKVKDGATAGDAVFGLSADEIVIENPSSGTGLGFDILASGFNAIGTSVYIDTFAVTSTKTATADKITFTNTLNGAPMDGRLWAVLYNEDDVLVSCGWVDIPKGDSSNTVEVKNAKYTTAKVFVWTADGYPLLKEPVEVE